MKKLIAGNWKMNGTLADAKALISDICSSLSGAGDLYAHNDFVVCPPQLHVSLVKEVISDTAAKVSVGVQDCSVNDFGAYTGDTSPAMAKDMGCEYVILGHSERREYQEESDELIAQKAVAAHKQNLITIICVGETDVQRDAGTEKDIVAAQLEKSMPECCTATNTVIAYEPVWAIGTGKTATPEDVRQMHEFIREKLKEKLADSEDVRILYGGSVKPANAAELFAVPNVDGALIGGASLKAEDFLAIAGASVEIAQAA